MRVKRSAAARCEAAWHVGRLLLLLLLHHMLLAATVERRRKLKLVALQLALLRREHSLQIVEVLHETAERTRQVHSLAVRDNNILVLYRRVTDIGLLVGNVLPKQVCAVILKSAIKS